ncbi:MAG TPA: xanthine dehydrogenase family protein subunit M [Chloroflexota bacterium]
MKEFEYQAPASLDQAVKLLSELNGRARPMAGGTDLLVQIRQNRQTPDRVVDVKKVPELNELRYDPSQGLTIGAAVPCYLIYQDQNVAKSYPGLVDSASIIGGIGIQGRATLGGNLCNSSPSGDALPTMIALGATALIAGPQGRREVPVEQFCTAPARNVLQPGELLVAIRFPAPRANSGAHYQRFIPRYEMDIAVVGVGAQVELDRDKRTIRSARIALGAVAPTPLFVPQAGAALEGKPATEESFRQAAEIAREAAKPISDMRGTAEQRTHLVGVLTRRVLMGAAARARGEVVHASH